MCDRKHLVKPKPGKLTAEAFTSHGMTDREAEALVSTILDQHRAPDMVKLHNAGGFNLYVAREICSQIHAGMGNAPSLVQWGISLDLADAIVDAINKHSPWRPYSVRKAELADA